MERLEDAQLAQPPDRRGRVGLAQEEAQLGADARTGHRRQSAAGQRLGGQLGGALLGLEVEARG